MNLHREGVHTTVEIAELFGVARSTVYRAIQRAEGATLTQPAASRRMAGAGEPL